MRFKVADSKGRINLGTKLANKLYLIEVKDGNVILKPAKVLKRKGK